ncbi:MAG TPA: methylmalonyl-CoA epimerase [Thermomicrobiaceae bacterium]|nr:methylmalonyl-CoA epimerase [Thermomicrobiaceae bacterium]
MKRLDHVGIAVADIPEAAAFLTDILGLESDGPAVALPEQGVSVRFLRAGDDRLELLAPTDEEGALARFLAKHGEGLHHLCFEVDDIEAELDRLDAAGVRLVDRHAWRSPHGYAAYIHPKAWRGVAIELRQRYRTGEGGSSDDRP